MKECKLQLNDKSISKFRQIVYNNDLSFAYLHLEMEQPLHLKESKYVVGVSHWVWTFYGRHGGLEFLRWPIEFQIWSLGLLNSFVGGPFDMFINKAGGNCSYLNVGEDSTDLAISRALVNLTYALHEPTDGQYDSSFWCYRKRTYLYPEYLYLICQHIVCPFVAIKYSCCSFVYNIEKQHREVKCGKEFLYDQVWWLAPVFVAILLFSFFPLIIFRIAAAIWKDAKESSSNSFTKDYMFLDRTNQITLLKTLCSPFSFVARKSPVCFSRVVRFSIPFFSFSVIGLQIILDHMVFPKYVEECVRKGVPMGFRSMASGFRRSAVNFLPYLGGPYVACSAYLLITCFLVSVPKSLFQTLSSSLGINFDTPRNSALLSPFRLTVPVLERYGSVSIRKRHGYKRIYAVYVAQMNLLINIKFWKIVYDLHLDRWKNFRTSIGRACLLPLYLILCFLEIILCILVYGFPIISFGINIFRAYRNLLLRNVHNRVWKPFVVFFSVTLVFCVVFFLFMFCTIFLDTCLFIARVCIFTYTGIILYPRVAYGYLIFLATAVYYLWDSIENFSRYYFQLLRTTVSVCESVERSDDVEPLVKKSRGFKGIRITLFEDVIESYCPRRKKVIASFLKVFVILGIMGLSVHFLIKTNTFQDLHVIMHVGTTLLICAFPKIIKSLCSDQNSRIKQLKARAEIKGIVRKFMGYISDDTDDDID